MSPRHSQEMPSRNEDEFFAKQDAELMKQMRDKLDQERAAQERKAHFMKCPKCGADLREEAHGQVKVDLCPDCGGMWLDAGELEMLRVAQKGGNPLKGIVDMFTRSNPKK